MNALVFGATGLCGSAFLRHAAQSPAISKVYAITRSELPEDLKSSKVSSVVNGESDKWSELIPEDTEIFMTGLATTRAAAGGLDKQYKIDHDMNIELAKAAKAKGYKVCVIVSSSGASVDSRLPYFRMKGEIERDILALDFDKTVILRPGVLLGQRYRNFRGFGANVAEKLGGWVYRGKLQSLLSYPIYGDEVGKVGVQLATDTSKKDKVQIIGAKELLELSQDKK